MLKIRFLSAVLSIAMLSSVIMVPAAHASEDDVLRATAEPAIVKCGDHFTYVLSMDSLDGVAGIQASFTYDDDTFEYNSNEFSGGFSYTKCDAGNGIINIAAASAGDFEFSGEFLKIDFTVKDIARTGEYSLESVGDVIIAKGTDGDTASVDIQPVSVDNADHAVFSFNCENTKLDETGEAEYTVNLSGLHGIHGYQAELYYDDENFDIVSLEPSGNGATVKYADGVIGIAEKFDGDTEGVDLEDYPVATIKIKAADECPNGKYTPFDTKSIIVSLNGNEKETELSCDCSPIIVGYDTAVTMHAVPSTHSVRAGDELTYSLDIDSELECNGMQTVFTYDPDILKFTGDENTIGGELIKQEGADKEINISDGAIGIACSYKNAITMNGQLATLSFCVKSDAQTGDVAAQIGETLFAGNNGENIDVKLERNVEPVSVSEETGIYDLTLTANRTKIMPGETVDVAIAIPKVENLYHARLTITYDASLFEPLKNEEQTGAVYNAASTHMVSYNYKEKVGVWISFPSMSRYTGGGDIVTFKFKAKEGADATGSFVLNVESSTPELTAPVPVKVRSSVDSPAQSVIDAIEAAAAAVDAADSKVDEVFIDGADTITSAGEELSSAKTAVDSAEAAVSAAERAYKSLSDEFKYYAEEAKGRLDNEIKNKLAEVQRKCKEKDIEYNQLKEANTSGEDYINSVNALKNEYSKSNKITRDNYELIKQALDAAEESYGKLNSYATDRRKFPAVAAAHDEYEAILNEYNKFYADLEAAKAIEERIDALGDVTLDNYESKQRECDDIRLDFSKLTEDQQNLVGNKEKLSEVLAACTVCKEKDEKAKAVAALIEAIDVESITLDSETQIEEARAAYEKLDEVDTALKARVSNYSKLLEAEQRIKDLKAAKEDAAEVDRLIDEIGDVTLDSATAIHKARTAYDELSTDAKGFVEKLDTLTAAEARYDELYTEQQAIEAVELLIDMIDVVEYTPECEEKIKAARKAYNELKSDELRERVTNKETLKAAEAAYAALKADHDAADRVTAMIKAIGDVTLESGDDIAAAEQALQALTETQRSYVSEDDVELLKQYRTAYDNLAAAHEVDEAITAIGDVNMENFAEKKEFIDKARTAYDGLTSDRQELVKNLDALTAAEIAYANCKAVDDVIGKIEAIGEVTLAKAEQIRDAKESYQALTPEQQKLVPPEKLQTLTDAEKAYAKLVADETDRAAAAEVVEKIEAIGEVTLEKEQAIQDARAAYEALTEERKLLVPSEEYKKLTDAEAELARLKQEEIYKAAAQKVSDLIEAIGEVTLAKAEQIRAASEAYGNLSDDEKKYVPAETLTKLTNAVAKLEALEKEEDDKKAAAAVDEKIVAIGEVTLEKEEAIKAAREAYDSLTDIQKGYVTKLEELTAAETALAELKQTEADKAAAAAVDEKIAAIGEVSLEKEEAIKAAREAYDSLTDTQKGYVTKLEELTAAEAALEKLNKLEYTADYEIDGEGKLKVTARKYKSDGAAVLVTAIYKDDILQNVHIENIAEAREFEFTYDCEGDNTVKLMFWNNMTEMKPVTECIAK